MFSKAPIKRYYDDVGCAPGPNKYDPKGPRGGAAVSMSKSHRFLEPKFVAPAPNQYQQEPLRIPVTPSKRTTPASASSLKLKGSVRRPHPSFDLSQRSEGSSSCNAAGIEQLEAEISELRARNTSLLETIVQLTSATTHTQPVGTDGVILSAIPADGSAAATDAPNSPITSSPVLAKLDRSGADSAAADCVQHLLDVVERDVTCQCQQLSERVASLSTEGQSLRQQLLTMCDHMEQLQLSADTLESADQLRLQQLQRQEQLMEQVTELKQTAQAQKLRIKELELLVQVARESEREAHEDTCRLSDRLVNLEGQLENAERERATLELTRDDLSTQLVDTVERLNAEHQRREASEREQHQLRARCDGLDAELCGTAEQMEREQRQLEQLREALQQERRRAEQLAEQDAASRQSRARLDAELAAARDDAETRQTEQAEAELQLAALEGSLAALSEERDELTAARAALQMQLDAQFEQQQASLSNIDRLTLERTQLAERLSALEVEAERAAEEAVARAAERDNVCAQLAEARAEMQTLSSQLGSASERGEQLSSQLWYAGLQRQLSQQDADELQRTLIDREQAIARLETVRRDKEQRLQQLATRSDQMQLEIRAAAAELEHTRAAVQTERERSEQLEQGRSEMQELLQQEKLTLSLAAAEAQARLDELHCELDMARSETSRVARAADEREVDLKHQLARAEKQLDTAKTELETEQVERERAEKLMQKTRTELEDAYGSLNATEMELKRTQETVASLKNEISEREAQVTTLQSQVGHLDVECGEYRGRVQTLEMVETEMETKLAKLERVIAEQKEEAAISVTALAEEKFELKNLQAKRSEEAATLKALNQLRDGLEAELESTQQGLAAAEADAAAQRELCDRQQLELTQQRGRVSQLESSLAKLEDELVAARRVQTDLREQNVDLAQVCDEQLAELTERRKEVDTLTETLHQQENNSSELSERVEKMQQRHAEAVESHHAAEAVVATVRENMQEMKQLYDEIVEEKDSELAELREQVEKATGINTEQADRFRAELTELSEKLGATESARNQAATESDILRNEIKLTNSSIEYLELELKQKTADAEAASDELTQRAVAAESEAAAEKARAEQATQQAAADREEARVTRLLLAEEQRHGARLAADGDQWRSCAEAARLGRAQAETAAAAARSECDAAEQRRREQHEQTAALQAQLTAAEAGHERDLEQLYQNFSDLRHQVQRSARGEAAARELAAEVPRLQEALRAAEEAARDQRDQLKLAEQQLLQQEQHNEWKEKYEKLFALVEPFQHQLELYREERRCLLDQTEGTRAELERLAGQYSQLLGHQNKKQKIHHIMQLKQENLSLKNKLATVEKKLSRQRLLQRQLEERLAGDQNSTLRNATVSSLSKSRRASYDLSRTAPADHLQHALPTDSLSLVGVTPLKENAANRGIRSPMATRSAVTAADSAVKKARAALQF